MIVRHSAEIRAALDIPESEEDIASWEKMVSTLNENIPDPAKAKIYDSKGRELKIRYDDLSKKRVEVDAMLRSIQLNAAQPLDKRKMISSLTQDGVKRNLARYIEDRFIYDSLYLGEFPAGTSLPPYMSKYVESREMEKTTLNMTERLLPIQYDVRDRLTGVAETPGQLEPQAMEILTVAVRLDIKMSRILSCLHADGSMSRDDQPYIDMLNAWFPVKEGQKWDRENINAMRFAVGYLTKYQKNIQAYADLHKKDIKEVTVAEALDCCLQGSLIGRFAEEIGANMQNFFHQPDIRAFMRSTFDDATFISKNALDLALAPLRKVAQENGQSETFEEDTRVVVSFFRVELESKNVRTDFLKEIAAGKLNGRQEKIASSIINQVVGGAINPETQHTVNAEVTIERLKRATFITDSPDGTMNKQIIATLEQLLHEKKISGRDLFDLYYLMSIEGSDLLLAYKTVSLLESAGRNDLSSELQMSLLAKLTRLCFEDPESVEKQLEKVGIDEASRRELQNVRQYLLDQGLVGPLRKARDWIVSFHRNFPWYITVPTDIAFVKTAAYGATKFVGRGLLTREILSYERFAIGGIEEVRKGFQIPASVSEAEIRLAQGQMNKILVKLHSIFDRWHIPFLEARGARAKGQMLLGDTKTGSDALRSNLKKAGYTENELTEAFQKPVRTPSSSAPGPSPEAQIPKKVPLTPSQLDDAIDTKLIGLDNNARTMIKQSPTARSLVKGALESGSEPELLRIVSAAKKATVLRAGMNVVGAGADIFGVIMAFVDWQANKERIAQTDNPELQKLYAQANLLYAAEGTASATGLVIGGVAVYQSLAAGNSVLVSLGAPAGAIMLPIGITVAGARQIQHEHEELQAYAMTRDTDLQRMSSSTILSHVAKSKPWQSLNGVQSITSAVYGEKEAGNQEGLNANARRQGYRGYFAQSAYTLLPVPTEADVRSLRKLGVDAKGTPAPVGQEELNTLYKDWIAQYVLEAEKVIGERTNGQFYLIDPVELGAARSEAYARCMTRMWGADIVDQKISGLSIEMQWKNEIVMMSNTDPALFSKALPRYLLDRTSVRDALAFADMTLEGETLISAADKDGARTGLLLDCYTQMRQMMERVESGQSITAGDIDRLAASMKRSAEDVSHFVPRKGEVLADPNKLRSRIQALKAPATSEVLHEILRRFPGIQPKTAGAEALTLEGLERYPNGNGLVSLILTKSGTEPAVGHFSTHESYWIQPSKPNAKLSELTGTQLKAGTIDLPEGEYKVWRKSDNPSRSKPIMMLKLMEKN